MKRRFPVHVTMKLIDGLPRLRQRSVLRVLLIAFQGGRSKFGFRLNQWSIQRNHILQTPREVRNALNYVLNNAAFHRIRRPRPVPDEYSSWAWFDGWRHVKATPPKGEPPVAPPRTWLLRTGWRRHGLLLVAWARRNLNLVLPGVPAGVEP